MEQSSSSKQEHGHVWVIAAAIAVGLRLGWQLRGNSIPDHRNDESAPQVQQNSDNRRLAQGVGPTLEVDEQATFRANADGAHASANEDQKQYDTQLLVLSSAFLAASLAFIKDVVHISEAIHLHFLDGSFVLFILCIFLVLFSFQYSIHIQYKAKEYWEARAHGDANAKFPYRSARFIKSLNCFAGIVFFLGVVSAAFFVLSNLNMEAHMTKMVGNGIANDGQFVKLPSRVPTSSSDAEKGSNIKTPPPARPQSDKPSSGTGSVQPRKP